MTDVAILLPFRDAERFLPAALASILTQTHTNWTLIAVDDRSSDGSADLLRATADPRIQLIPSQGAGVAAALNTGLRFARKFRWAARHDADDVSSARRLAQQLAYVAEHPELDVLATQVERIDATGAWLRSFPQIPQFHDEIIAELKNANPICHGSTLMRTSKVLQVGGYDTAYPVAQGYDLWVRLAAAGARFGCLPEVLYQYRTYDESWSRSQITLRDQLLEQIRERAATLL